MLPFRINARVKDCVPAGRMLEHIPYFQRRAIRSRPCRHRHIENEKGDVMALRIEAWVVVPLLLAAGAAQADTLRPLCADRPGLGTPPCTIDPGHALVELGGVDWTTEHDATSRTDTVVAGDLLVRYGLTDSLEAQVGYTAFGTVRTRDRLTGKVTHDSGTGDATVALKKNLVSPDGSGFSIAAMGYATLPTGGQAIGAGDWSAGFLMPISYSLTDTLQLALTPQVSAEVDGDRDGRHLAYSNVVGLAYALTKKLNSTLEFQAIRDDDPGDHTTQLLGSLSFGWQPQDDLQLDMGAVAGLNHESPDAEVYLGISRRF